MSLAAASAHYAESPACALVATHCACCGLPLLDAISVELGIGPWCRRKHGYAAPESHAEWAGCDAALEGTPALEVVRTEKCHPRLAANYLVWLVALAPESLEAHRYVAALYRLGFVALAAKIAKRIAGVVVEVEGDDLVMHAPYSDSVNAALRLAGVRSSWDRKAKARRIAKADATNLWRALRGALKAGTVVVGAKRASLVGA